MPSSVYSSLSSAPPTGGTRCARVTPCLSTLTGLGLGLGIGLGLGLGLELGLGLGPPARARRRSGRTARARTRPCSWPRFVTRHPLCRCCSSPPLTRGTPRAPARNRYRYRFYESKDRPFQADLETSLPQERHPRAPARAAWRRPVASTAPAAALPRLVRLRVRVRA